MTAEKKVISFSLWGDQPKYTFGAIENAHLIAKIYGEEWIGRYYCGTSVPASILIQLQSIPWVEIVEMDVPGDWEGLFWRFFPASEPDVNVMLSRDTDSRLSLRERVAVEEWLLSKKLFHIMRDHPYHCVPILGGMWGAKKGAVPDMKKLIADYHCGNYWQTDQEFLKNIIYPNIKSTSFVHDSFFICEPHVRPFPTHREHGQFVGQVYDHDNIPDKESSIFLQSIENKIRRKNNLCKNK